MALGRINHTGLAAATGLSQLDLLRAEVRGWVLVGEQGWTGEEGRATSQSRSGPPPIATASSGSGEAGALTSLPSHSTRVSSSRDQPLPVTGWSGRTDWGSASSRSPARRISSNYKRQVEKKLSISSQTLLNNFSTFSSAKHITSVILSLLGEAGQPEHLSPLGQAHQDPLDLLARLGRGGVILSCKASE